MSPISLIWVLVQVSPDTGHVSGGTEQEGLHLLIQQGLQTPACLTCATLFPCTTPQKQYWLLGLLTHVPVMAATWKDQATLKVYLILQNEFSVNLGKLQRPCLKRKSKMRGQQDGSVGKKLLATNLGNLSLIPRST